MCSTNVVSSTLSLHTDALIANFGQATNRPLYSSAISCTGSEDTVTRCSSVEMNPPSCLRHAGVQCERKTLHINNSLCNS